VAFKPKIMRRLLTLLFVAFGFMQCQSQKTDIDGVDLKKISSEVQDSTSKYYYPVLISKFHFNPQELSEKEINHLYFGYSFIDKQTVDSTQTSILQEIFDGDTLTGPKLYSNRIIEICDSILERCPFDLWVINHELLFLEGEKKQLRIAQQKTVLKAIQKTGSGLSEKSPYLIIDPFHAKLIAHEHNLNFESIEIRSNQLHVMRLKENSENIHEMYFRIIK
jgi:hypothetical protein